MAATQHYVEANEKYASQREPVQLPLPPSRHVAVLTCMDARILPEVVLGLKEGESHVIRNAGGRAPEAIRSLVISQQLLGTKEILVIQHTDCGMLTFTTEQARNLVTTNLSLQSGSTSKNYIDNLNFLDFSNLEANIKSDVDFLKSNELIRAEKITGYVYDVKTGALKQVA